MEGLDVEAIRREWAGFEFDQKDFPVREEAMLAWARAAGERDPRFVDPSHPEFRAHPGFTSQFVGGQMFPADFPRIGRGPGIDGGKCVTCHAPVRSGDVLTARSSIADVYEKTGRSGSMVFVVHRMDFSNQRGEAVSTVDWRLIQSPGR